MKKGQLVFNVIISVAVVAALVLNFIGKNGGSEEQDASAGTEKVTKPAKIAYVNIDTLLNNYDYYFDIQKHLQSKQQSSQSELDLKTKEYEKNVKDYQYKAQRGLITRSDAQALEQKLAQQEQEIMGLRQQLSMKLAEEEQVKNRQLINEIMEYLKDFNKGKNYEYIFSTTFGSNILYAADSLDITQEVLEGLNTKYKESLNKKE